MEGDDERSIPSDERFPQRLDVLLKDRTESLRFLKVESAKDGVSRVGDLVGSGRGRKTLARRSLRAPGRIVHLKRRERSAKLHESA